VALFVHVKIGFLIPFMTPAPWANNISPCPAQVGIQKILNRSVAVDPCSPDISYNIALYKTLFFIVM
jgi:hypothetical protein